MTSIDSHKRIKLYFSMLNWMKETAIQKKTICCEVFEPQNRIQWKSVPVQKVRLAKLLLFAKSIFIFMNLLFYFDTYFVFLHIQSFFPLCFGSFRKGSNELSTVTRFNSSNNTFNLITTSPDFFYVHWHKKT